MSAIATGLGLATAASVAQSSGFLCQHRGAADRRPVRALHPIASLRSLLAARRWLLGLTLGATGFGLQLCAFAFAPLSLVQAFVAGGLALAVPTAVLVFRHRPTRSEVRAVTLMAAALVLLAIGIQGGGDSFSSLRLALYSGGGRAGGPHGRRPGRPRPARECPRRLRRRFVRGAR
jgi:hypothetical protein